MVLLYTVNHDELSVFNRDNISTLLIPVLLIPVSSYILTVYMSYMSILGPVVWFRVGNENTTKYLQMYKNICNL